MQARLPAGLASPTARSAQYSPTSRTSAPAPTLPSWARPPGPSQIQPFFSLFAEDARKSPFPSILLFLSKGKQPCDNSDFGFFEALKPSLQINCFHRAVG